MWRLDPLPRKGARRMLGEAQFESLERPDLLPCLLASHPSSPPGPLKSKSLAPLSWKASRQKVCLNCLSLLGWHCRLMAALALHFHGPKLCCVLLGLFPGQTCPSCLSLRYLSAKLLAAAPYLQA